MKKPNLIVRKKHIILACLTLILGIAIYLNYAFTQTGKELTGTDVLSAKVNTNGETLADGKDREGTVNYGDAQYVNSEAGANTVAGEEEAAVDYFAQARIDKMAKRDEAVETLQAMLGGGDITGDEAAVMTLDAINMSKLVESEGKIESLVKAQGFEECVVYLDGKTASIVVKSEGLVPSEAAQIKDILLGEVAVEKENITIFEVK